MLLPIVLWGPQPPSHSITYLFLSRDDRVLITGSREGQLLVSDVFPQAIIPRSFLIGHSAKIIGIDQLLFGHCNLHVVSAATNGEIFKWDVTDGSFMTSTTLQGPLTQIQSLPSSQNILVCGQYGAMTVLDPLTLATKHTLITSDPTHWISCHTIYQPPKTKDEEVVAMTTNGHVKTWNLQFESKETVILESETKILTCPRPVCVRYNPKSLYNCLIVCQGGWRIYRAGDFVLLCSGATTPGVSWAGGKFYTPDKVLLWKETGTVCVFQLPPRAIRSVDPSSVGWSAEPPSCLFSVTTGDLQSCVMYHKRSMRTTHDILLRGDRNGKISLWKQDKAADISQHGLGANIETSLEEAWRKGVVGLVNEDCVNCGRSVRITSSVFLEPLCYVACGLASGDIVVDKVHHLVSRAVFNCTGENLTDSSRRLVGHIGSVCVLLHPHSKQPQHYSQTILYSGGADYSVKIWDWKKEVLLQSFTIHTGPVTRLFLPPPDSTGKLRGSVVSVCEDNTVAITTHSQCEPLFCGSCHHTRVLDVRWRLQEAMLLVHCRDDTVYVWGLSTGHLDRIERGPIALHLIAASKVISESEECSLGFHPPEFSKQSSGLSLLPFRFTENDYMSHIMMFDTELLLYLLSQIQGNSIERDHVDKHSTSNGSVSSPTERRARGAFARALDSKVPDRRGSLRPTDRQTDTAKLLEERSMTLTAANPGEYNRSSPSLPSDTDEVVASIKMTCSLLLSCLHAWTVDLNIDRTCVKHLGLMYPVRQISYGTVSSDSTAMLLVPGWEGRVQEHSGGAIHPPYGRWCLSPSLTTQHLLSVSALANKQMSTDMTLTYNYSLLEPRGTDREEQLRASLQESEKKAGWSHVTALHCIVLPEHVPSGYCSPLLTQLAIKWQDRCMEVREASQALFLRELRRIGFTGRQQLVNQWYPYIVRKKTPCPPQPLERACVVELPVAPDYFQRFINTPSKTKSAVSMSEHEHSAVSDMYSVSVIILGVIVSEFPDEVELAGLRSHVTSSERREAIRSSFLLTHDMLKMTAAHLFTQLIKPTSQIPLHSPIRRASVDLIGRGYNVWGDFLNLTAVIMTLLELQTDPLVPIEIKKTIAQSGNIPDTGNKECLAAAATVRAAYQASILIANNKPQHTVTSLSKEVMTFKCDLEAGLSIQALSSFPSSYHTTLDKGRYPIYLLVQNIIEKTRSRELSSIIVKVVEIMLFCIDTEQFKTRTFSELVPSFTRNPLIDYCPSTQQVAVGSNEGLVHLFDVRSGKCSPLHAHGAPTSAVSLSTNGRTLVTYSEQEGKVSIWQSSSGLLSLMSPGPLKLVRVVESLHPLPPGRPSRLPAFRWDATKLVSLHLNDGTKKSFAV